jgi:hypothetical protein
MNQRNLRRQSLVNATFAYLGVVLVLCLCAPPARAQSALTRDERNVFHFAFGSQLGSGVYLISGRSVQIYRIPFQYEIKPVEPTRPGVRLTLPVTLGFIGFKPQDVVGTGLPEDIDSVSFVPGVALTFAVRSDWQIEPFVEAGIARDRTSDFDERVYAAGLRSRFEFPWRSADWMLFNELVHARAEQRELDDRDDFTRLRTGLVARRAFNLARPGRRPDFLLYALHEWFADPPDGPVQGEERDGSAFQYEIGVTFGATETLRLGAIPLPRIGLGYRFGSDLSAVRVVFGSPF